MSSENNLNISIDDKNYECNIKETKTKRETKNDNRKFWLGLLAGLFISVGWTIGYSFYQDKNLDNRIKKLENNQIVPIDAFGNKNSDSEVFEKSHNFYNSQFTNLLTVFALLITVGGVAIPFVSYFFQRQSLKDEKERIYTDIKTLKEIAELNKDFYKFIIDDSIIKISHKFISDLEKFTKQEKVESNEIKWYLKSIVTNFALTEKNNEIIKNLCHVLKTCSSRPYPPDIDENIKEKTRKYFIDFHKKSLQILNELLKEESLTIESKKCINTCKIGLTSVLVSLRGS